MRGTVSSTWSLAGPRTFTQPPSSVPDPPALRARRAALATLTDDVWDLLVVGGGITGAGVARDAARRGLRVALVEADDLASGTSSRSSRLVHGGVRYLEHGHLGLVFEASRERRMLLRLAPHLVRPLAFTWPTWRGGRLPRWKVAAGLALYDALALFGNVGRHAVLDPAAVLAREPAVRARGLTGGVAYWDAATDDARLTLATARDAAAAGAHVVTHARLTGLALPDRAGAAPARATVRDASGMERGDAWSDARSEAWGDASGDGAPRRVPNRSAAHGAGSDARSADGAAVEVRARVVVNCAGPWGDAVRRLADAGAPGAVLGAKGVHVAVPAARLGVRGAVTLLHPRDGRVLFLLPADGCTIVGTTETPAERGPEAVRATEADVAYLLDAANHACPEARLTRDDVVAAWAGIRPLAAAARGARATGAGTGSASREHAVERDPRGMVTVSGGKLTTYRRMAAEIVDACGVLLGQRLRPSDTAHATLPGGDVSLDDATRAAVHATADAAVGRRLARAHGSAWADVWALADPARGGDARLAARIDPVLPYVGAEFVHAVQHEWALTLADLLVRRAAVAYETRDAGRAAARVVAPLVAPLLGWDTAAQARALARYDAEAARLFGVD